MQSNVKNKILDWDEAIWLLRSRVVGVWNMTRSPAYRTAKLTNSRNHYYVCARKEKAIYHASNNKFLFWSICKENCICGTYTVRHWQIKVYSFFFSSGNFVHFIQSLYLLFTFMTVFQLYTNGKSFAAYIQQRLFILIVINRRGCESNKPMCWTNICTYNNIAILNYMHCDANQTEVTFLPKQTFC